MEPMYVPEENGWNLTNEKGKREYRKNIGESTVLVTLQDVYTNPNKHDPTIAVQGDWTMEGESDIRIELRDITDSRLLQRLDEKFVRFALYLERKETYRASRGGEIIRKKGRHAINPFTI